MKSANCLISETGRVKISDLGLGRFLTGDQTQATAGNAGTFCYMSPEQIDGRCGFSSDIYAFGVILWEVKSTTFLCFVCDSFYDISVTVTNLLLILQPRVYPSFQYGHA